MSSLRRGRLVSNGSLLALAVLGALAYSIMSAPPGTRGKDEAAAAARLREVAAAEAAARAASEAKLSAQLERLKGEVEDASSERDTTKKLLDETRSLLGQVKKAAEEQKSASDSAAAAHKAALQQLEEARKKAAEEVAAANAKAEAAVNAASAATAAAQEAAGKANAAREAAALESLLKDKADRAPGSLAIKETPEPKPRPPPEQLKPKPIAPPSAGGWWEPPPLEGYTFTGTPHEGMDYVVPATAGKFDPELNYDFSRTAIVTMAAGNEAARGVIALVHSLRAVGTRAADLVVMLSKGGQGSPECRGEDGEKWKIAVGRMGTWNCGRANAIAEEIIR